MSNNLVLIDGMNILFRGICVPGLGGAKYLIRCAFQYRSQFTHAAVIFDPPGGRRNRGDNYKKAVALAGGADAASKPASYKGNRSTDRDLVSREREKAETALRVMGIKTICIVGEEADDVIASLVRAAYRKKFSRILILTRDQDLLSCLRRETVEWSDGVLRKKRADFVKEFGFEPKFHSDYIALKGKTGQVPGLPGIGDVGAKHLIKSFGGVEKMLSSKGADTWLTRVQEHPELLRVCLQLAKLDSKVSGLPSLKSLQITR